MSKFERFKLLVGNDNFEKIANKTILIVGVGGVGGYTLESLVRNGLKNIIIIDNDIVDSSNLNRQIIALENNVGLKKVAVAKERALKINSEVNITPISIFLDKHNISILDKYNIDYLVDACDSINTKFELIKYALQHNIKIICSMGTGKRLDASKLQITTIDKTNYDPLARNLRKKLREEHIKDKIPVVWSNEIPLKIDNKKIASNSYVPATAGLLITSYIINDILKSHHK